MLPYCENMHVCLRFGFTVSLKKAYFIAANSVRHCVDIGFDNYIPSLRTKSCRHFLFAVIRNGGKVRIGKAILGIRIFANEQIDVTILIAPVTHGDTPGSVPNTLHGEGVATKEIETQYIGAIWHTVVQFNDVSSSEAQDLIFSTAFEQAIMNAVCVTQCETEHSQCEENSNSSCGRSGFGRFGHDC